MIIKIRTLQNIMSWGSLILGIILLFLEFFLNADPIGLIILTSAFCISGSVLTLIQRHTGNHIGAKSEK